MPQNYVLGSTGIFRTMYGREKLVSTTYTSFSPGIRSRRQIWDQTKISGEN